MQENKDVEVLTNKVEMLQEKIDTNNQTYQQLYQGSNDINSRISNQLATTTLTIEVISLFLTVAGLLLGWHISRSYNRIVKIRAEIDRTKRYIDEHDTELYRRLQRDDTLALLNRLNEVPEDISNVVDLLFARNLQPEDYLSLRESYSQLSAGDQLHREHYLQLFIQHFGYATITDPDIKNDLAAFIIPSTLGYMFPRDIEYFTGDIFKLASEKGLEDEYTCTLIQKLFLSLYRSKHKGLFPLVKKVGQTHSIPWLKVKEIVLKQAEVPGFRAWLDG